MQCCKSCERNIIVY